MPEPQLYLPAARSTLAPSVDSLFHVINGLSIFLFLLIVGAGMYWVAKYRRQPGDEKKLSKPTYHNTAVELFWSVGPMLVCIGLFHFGVRQYLDARVAPSDAMQVRVRGRKWAWEFEYANGKVSSDLHAPVNKPVKLVMTSQDVIHSFYVPDFRIKQDVLPGRYSMVWFQATQEGTDQVFCAEYCGLDHSGMLTKVVVESDEAFKKWLDFDPYNGMPLAQVGEKLYTEKACVTCHTLDGSPKAGGGPTFKGLYGRMENISDGTQVKVDDNYIRESILVPGAKIVKGYQPIMPSFQGSLKDRHVEGLIEFIKAQK